MKVQIKPNSQNHGDAANQWEGWPTGSLSNPEYWRHAFEIRDLVLEISRNNAGREHPSQWGRRG